MTIKEAIDRAKKQTGNDNFDEYALTDWLSEVDGKLAMDFFKFPVWEGYCDDTDSDEELLVSHPWDDFYVQYLAAMIHYSNMEYEQYTAAMQMYNAKELEFRQWARRNRYYKGRCCCG